MVSFNTPLVTGSGQVDFALAKSLESQTQNALGATLARLRTARSRFDESTGDHQVDAACLELQSAECELRAIYARCGHNFTPEKKLQVQQLLAGGTRLRPEFPQSASS